MRNGNQLSTRGWEVLEQLLNVTIDALRDPWLMLTEDSMRIAIARGLLLDQNLTLVQSASGDPNGNATRRRFWLISAAENRMSVENRFFERANWGDDASSDLVLLDSEEGDQNRSLRILLKSFPGMGTKHQINWDANGASIWKDLRHVAEGQADAAVVCLTLRGFRADCHGAVDLSTFAENSADATVQHGACKLFARVRRADLPPIDIKLNQGQNKRGSDIGYAPSDLKARYAAIFTRTAWGG